MGYRDPQGASVAARAVGLCTALHYRLAKRLPFTANGVATGDNDQTYGQRTPRHNRIVPAVQRGNSDEVT